MWCSQQLLNEMNSLQVSSLIGSCHTDILEILSFLLHVGFPKVIHHLPILNERLYITDMLSECSVVSLMCSFVTKTFWPEVRTDGKYWRDNGCSLDEIPNHFQFAADASTRCTAGRLCSSPQSHSSPFLQQTRLNRNPTVSTGLASWFLFSVFHSILCVLVSHLVEKQNCSEESVGPGIIAGLLAGRSALQWQSWNHNWRQQSSVTAFLWLCVLVLNITARIVDWVLTDIFVTPGVMTNPGTDKHSTKRLCLVIFSQD